jgi:uncharacterized protein (DUF1015 family)
MPSIAPFVAYKPTRDTLGRIACPPYDVLSDDEARRLAKNDSASFVRIIRPEVDFTTEVNPHADAVYKKGRKNLHEFIAQGLIKPSSGPCLYCYRLGRGDHTQTGIVATVSLEEYERGLIKKHEFTRPKKENDRMRHLDETAANTGLIFLAYRARKEIDDLVERQCANEPQLQFTADDGITHTLWAIEDPLDVRLMQSAFSRAPALYVADGHHRIAAAHRLWKQRTERCADKDTSDYARVMAAIFPHDQLQILPYHRFVGDLAEISSEEFLRQVKKVFHVRETSAPLPSSPGSMGMFIEGRWRAIEIKIKPDSDMPIEERLDVAVLQKRLLEPILKIEDPRTNPRIEFVGGIHGTPGLEKRCRELPGSVAFACPAVTMDELLAVADSGAVMPPKSTWFEPKLRSGILTRLL